MNNVRAPLYLLRNSPVSFEAHRTTVMKEFDIVELWKNPTKSSASFEAHRTCFVILTKLLYDFNLVMYFKDCLLYCREVNIGILNQLHKPNSRIFASGIIYSINS